MVRVVVKGGVWKNTEDEILKAAISKYGKNQWARISSLLVRKTPKQCKARWMEWLDPAIKKTEWSKEEDEKLLHLAKLMPTQWRTIAPVVGRTANQCLERYQKLLDEAEMAENDELGLAGDGEGGPSTQTADEVRRLRPGEIDPDPENRPARPDPIDMDEDEKEMLSEARARLANTQGKKAKRKARERQLEEARRMAALQKKRELKAAGILMRAKPKKGGMDYMADIPFEKKPAAGFYDTTEEDARRVHVPVGKTLRELEGGKRKQDREEDARRAKKQKQRDQKDGKGGDVMAQFVPAGNTLQAQREEQQISKRRKLVLPGAQVGEHELEEIVKLGQAGESARTLVDENGNESTQGLLGEYSALGHAKNVRTPRTAPQADNVMAEARNLRNLTVQQTPLLGEENTPMRELIGRGTGFEGATPRHGPAATPNPLATPFRAGGAGDEVGATPRGAVGATPLRTPLRDNLSINAGDDASTMMGGDTPRHEKARLAEARQALKAGFMSLPQPKNEFELVLPEEEEEGGAGEGEGESAEVQAALRIEDASEREARLKAIKEAEDAAALARRTQVVKRGLPRPTTFDAAAFVVAFEQGLEISDPKDDDLLEIEKLVTLEMARLIENDAILYPVPGSRVPGGGKSALLKLSDDLLADARNDIHLELAKSVGLPGASDAVLRRTVCLTPDEFDQIWSSGTDSLGWDADTARWVEKDSLSADRRIRGLAALLEMNREKLTRDSAKATKAEKKLGVTQKGYEMRSKDLASKISDVAADIDNSRMELNSFRKLAANEQGAAVRRVEELRDEVDKLARNEREGQERFRGLNDMKLMLASSIEQLEMEEAELINEAALAAE